MGGDDLVIRAASSDDVRAIVALAGHALGWRPEDPNEALFRWKHFANPFGASPMWVAAVDGRLAGFRTFLRWEFEAPGGGALRAVRAVDTATLPEFQGRGIFRRLTLGAVDELTSGDVDFVFNTPNDQSRPGYLKMGWVQLGRIPVGARPTSLKAVARMARAKVPAGKWSLATRGGHPAGDVLSDEVAMADLVGSRGSPVGLRTRLTPEFLRWRYCDGPVSYRAIALDDDVRRGVVVFRLRDRGGAVEATIGDVLVPGGDGARSVRSLLRQVVHQAAPDYLIATVPSASGALAAGLVPMPRQGPILTWRALRQTDAPSMRDWSFALGDIELF